jgi:uncharacterized membrane protein YfcA
MTEFWLILSAVGAGVVNAIAGGGTLLTFPALATTMSEKAAAITSTFALMPGSFASSWGYRRELAECGRWVPLLTVPSIAGGAIGALLLILMPDSVFRRVVPWLVLLAATLFLVQPRLVAWIQRHRPSGPPSRRTLAVVVFCQFVIGIYGGYFGAGIGILMLTSLGFLGLASIHQMNALKTFLAACMNGVSVLFFVFSPEMHWPYGFLMAAASIAGGYCGARLALLMKPVYVRWVVIILGFSMAGYFFWKQMGT